MSTVSHRIVQLRAAKIPLIGKIAVHYWLVTWQDQRVERWEVWQRAHRCPHSWGHLHRNLMYHADGVGNGGSWIETQWVGDEADLLITTLENSPQSYPYKYLYRYWPGPNSNTYVQWILNQAQTQYSLGFLGIGKDYPLWNIPNLATVMLK